MHSVEAAWEAAEKVEKDRKHNRWWRRAGRAINAAGIRTYLWMAGGGER